MTSVPYFKYGDHILRIHIFEMEPRKVVISPIHIKNTREINVNSSF